MKRVGKPCEYRTGRTLGSGNYSVVKEAVHIKTGKLYACKIISKEQMQGQEHMVLNEINILKCISAKTGNMTILYDYFESQRNIYLVCDLCTGGDLFNRIINLGKYLEGDAARLVCNLLIDISYLHSLRIIHRDLKPENVLLRSPHNPFDVMIADYGLATLNIEDSENPKLLTDKCGTPRYMAPEVHKQTGYEKPVDIWAIGAITYFILAGHSPFYRKGRELEEEAIITGDLQFTPHSYWANVSKMAQNFIQCCLSVDPDRRPTAQECLRHEWLAPVVTFSSDPAQAAK
ncbi:hypothetical protein GYMLUDRAFT_79529 [Collybiopsis luxurians FD-317 M1]|nr:hypothetical protein GYMLUDRAFT_79529 [Collybiopsis luxurians FD-317 M1]